MLIDDLKAKFPNIDPTVIDTYFPLYETTYTCYYGASYGSNNCDDEIILFLLAHLITIADTNPFGESIKQVGSESVGGVSTSYIANALDNNDKFFTSTLYGQQYKLLTSKNMGMYFV
jgi:hypothetical protein